MLYVVVDRITSIRLQPPNNGGHTGVWRVNIHLGSDSVQTEFDPKWYSENGDPPPDPWRAFQMAKEDAVVFARELTFHINALKEMPR